MVQKGVDPPRAVEHIVVLGVSLGAMRALPVLLTALPYELPAPIVIVVHRKDNADDPLLVDWLRRNCRLPVEEAMDKTPMVPGHVYLAPSGYHLLVEDDHFALSTEAHVNFARPSVDVLFESAADYFKSNVVGIILTGAGRDGANGMAHIKRQGGFTIVQEPETAEQPSMPAAALAVCNADRVVPLEEIATVLTTYFYNQIISYPRSLLPITV